MNAQDLRLDYFKVYRFFPQTAPAVVELQGQFDTRGAERCELAERIWFANPVSKNGEPPFDQDAHLVRYRPKQPIPQPPRVVEIENQFGAAKIHLGDVIGLLVPARKIERGFGYPEQLDHYKMYWAYGERPVSISIKLKDQFDKTEVEVTVFQTVAFAVPVEKRHNDKVFSVQNDTAHLTLYSINFSRPIYRVVRFEDQFGWGYAYGFQSYQLAVPSVKHGWSEEY
jgi:hypothetical protein